MNQERKILHHWLREAYQQTLAGVLCRKPLLSPKRAKKMLLLKECAAPVQDWGLKPQEIEAPPNSVTLEYTQLLLKVAKGSQVCALPCSMPGAVHMRRRVCDPRKAVDRLA